MYKRQIIRIVDVFLNSTPLRSIKEGKYSFIDIDSNISIKLYHNDIIYIEYIDKCCYIHTMSGIYNIKRTSLVKLLKSLSDDEIIQMCIRDRLIDKGIFIGIVILT